jgi:CubicO group peptidase (beta-lactamase class C family)
MRRRVDDPYAGYTLDDLYCYLAKTSMERPAQALYQYSNLGYVVLAQAMVNATGTQFPQLISEKILEPAGMHDTFIEVSQAHESKLLPGHTPFGRPAVHWRSAVFAGCGGVCSTAADCLRFLQLLIEPPADFDSAVRNSLIPRVESGNEGETSHLSLGWKINDKTGWYWHNGVTGGHSAYLAFHPEKRLGIVAMTNRYTVRAVDQFAQHMQKVLEGGDPQPVTEPFPWTHATIMQAKIEFVHMPFWARSGAAAAVGGATLWAILRGLHS